MANSNQNNINVFWLNQLTSQITNSEIDALTSVSKKMPLGRSRICIHRNESADIHQMVINLTSRCYIRPAKHLDKSESICLLSGKAGLIFFDNNGVTEKIVNLELESKSGVRLVVIPQGVFHSIFSFSQSLTFLETAPGPFKPSQTEEADWSPVASDPINGLGFLKQHYELHKKTSA